MLLEYAKGKDEARLLLIIGDEKERNTWYEKINQYKTIYEDYKDSQFADYGLSSVEMKYRLAEQFEGTFNSNDPLHQIGHFRL